MLKVTISLAVLGLLVWVYVTKLRPRLRTTEELKAFYDHMDRINAGAWERIVARLDGWKTVILGVVGTVWLVLPELLQGLVGLQWTDLGLSDAWARIIGGVITIASVITRVASDKPEPPEAE